MILSQYNKRSNPNTLERRFDVVKGLTSVISFTKSSFLVKNLSITDRGQIFLRSKTLITLEKVSHKRDLTQNEYNTN